MSIEELFDSLPAKITRDGRKYRLNLTKSTKGAYTLFYKPMHGGGKPLITVTDASLVNVLARTKYVLWKG